MLWTRMKQSSKFFSTLLVGVTLAVSAQAALSSIGESDVQFQAVGPAGLKIDGKGAKVQAKESDGKIRFEVQLAELKTGMNLRDEHLRKALNTEKHPRAILVLDRSRLQFPEDQKELDASVQGELTLHGQTKTIPVQYRVKRTGSDYHVQARSSVQITDFGIKEPCYLGVCVDKNVKFRATLKLRDN